MQKLNEHKLSVTDIISHLGKQLETEHGIQLSSGQLKNLFIEAILRNIVLNEIADMMLYIADEEKFDQKNGFKR